MPGEESTTITVDVILNRGRAGLRSDDIFDIAGAVLIWIGLALLLFPIQLFVTAPYGRHAHGGWGPRLANRTGWIAMELVSLFVFGGLFLAGPVVKTAPMWVFFALWTAHYVNRSLVYPFRTRTRGKTMPLAIVLSAMVFNIVNGVLNGYYLGWLSDPYPVSWFGDPRFICGAAALIPCRRRDQPLGRCNRLICAAWPSED